MDLSVVIASKDRAESLRDTLTHIQRLFVQGLSWEVLVCDNSGSDSTQRVLKDFSGHLPLRTALQLKSGKNAALNALLPMVRGDLTVFTDDDVRPDKMWISSLVGAARRWPYISIFCGPITPLFPEHAPAWTRDARYAGFAYAAYRPQATEGPVFALPFGPNYAVRSSVLANYRFRETIGPNGSRYPMGGETELLRRLFMNGHRAVYVPAAHVAHVIRQDQITEDWLFERAQNLARGHVQMAGAPAIPSPFRLYTDLTKAFLRYISAHLRPTVRLQHGVSYHYQIGRWHETRRMRSTQTAHP